jgi:hypothetical protein
LVKGYTKAFAGGAYIEIYAKKLAAIQIDTVQWIEQWRLVA